MSTNQVESSLAGSRTVRENKIRREQQSYNCPLCSQLIRKYDKSPSVIATYLNNSFIEIMHGTAGPCLVERGYDSKHEAKNPKLQKENAKNRLKLTVKHQR